MDRSLHHGGGGGIGGPAGGNKENSTLRMEELENKIDKLEKEKKQRSTQRPALRYIC